MKEAVCIYVDDDSITMDPFHFTLTLRCHNPQRSIVAYISVEKAKELAAHINGAVRLYEQEFGPVEQGQ